MRDNIDAIIEPPVNPPVYIPYRCVVCNGWGTVSNQRITCHACKGKGYLEIPPQIDRERVHMEGHSKTFIMLKRNSQEFEYLVEKRPTAFALLAMIALRAKRTSDHPDPELALGEAQIGDYAKYGVSERQYRTDKKYLQKYGLATFKGTKLGTIARLVNSAIFDINLESETDKETKIGQTNDGIQPTNNNEKNNKNEKKRNIFSFTNEIVEDSDYKKLQELKHEGDDVSVRRKMSLQSALNSRYPYWKYSKQWDEANKQSRT